MELSQNQIQDLYNFTKKHFVEWYDLQTELVDHLANDIETILQENPHLSFKEARDLAFKKFGAFGFMEIVEQKTKQLNKKYWKLVIHELKAFFTIPKIAISLSLMFGLYTLLYHFKINRNIFLSMVLLLSVLPLYYIFKYRKALKKKVKKTGKKYLFEEYIFNLGGIVAVFGFPLQILLQIKNIHHPQVALWLSIFLIIYGLIMHIVAFILPKKIPQIIAKEHPEYAIKNYTIYKL